MSTLTIEDILNEVREEGIVEDSSFSKEASAQPSASSEFDLDDVDAMASFLKTASIGSDDYEYDPEYYTPSENQSLQEKIAEALILKDVLEEVNSPEHMFKVAAYQEGYTPEEVEQFWQEKMAAPRGRRLVQGAKYLAAATGAAGLGAYVGNKRGRKAGRTRGRREGFTAGRIVQNRIDNARVRAYLARKRAAGV